MSKPTLTQYSQINPCRATSHPPIRSRATLPLHRSLTPTYPQRRETLIGLPIPESVKQRIIRDSQAIFECCIPIRYTCTLTTKSGMMVEGSIVSHLELADYCLMKGLTLVSLDRNPELALSHERTSLG